MRYIQFYQKVLPELIECVGSDQLIKFDQRLSNDTVIMKLLGRKYPIPSNAIAYAIVAGDNVFHTSIVEGPVLITKTI